MADLYESEEDNLYSDNNSEDEHSEDDQQNSSEVDEPTPNIRLKILDIYFSGLFLSQRKMKKLKKPRQMLKLLMTKESLTFLTRKKDSNESTLFQIPIDDISECRIIRGYNTPLCFLYFDLKPEMTSLNTIQDVLKVEKALSVHLGDSETYIRICLDDFGNVKQRKFEEICNIPLEVRSASISRIERMPQSSKSAYQEDESVVESQQKLTFTCNKVQIGAYIVPEEWSATIELTQGEPKIFLSRNKSKGFYINVIRFINKSEREFNQSILSPQRSGWVFSFREYQLDMKQDLSKYIRVPNLKDFFDGYSQDEEKRFIKLWASPSSVDYCTALEKLQVIFQDIPSFSVEPLEDEPSTRKERSKRRKESESSETVKVTVKQKPIPHGSGSEKSNRLPVVNLQIDMLYLGNLNKIRDLGVVFTKDSVKFDNYSPVDGSCIPLLEFPTSALTRTRFYENDSSGSHNLFFFHFNTDSSSLTLLDMIKNKLESEVGVKRIVTNDQGVLRIRASKIKKEKMESLLKFVPNLEVCSDAEARHFEIIPTPCGSGLEESNRLSVVNLHMDMLYLGNLKNIRDLGIVFSKDFIKLDKYSPANDSYSPLLDFPTSALTRTRFYKNENSGPHCFLFFHFNTESFSALLDMIKNKLRSEVGVKRIATNDQSVLRICALRIKKKKLDSLFKFIPNLELCSETKFEVIPTPAPFIFTCSRILCGSFNVVNSSKTVSSVEIKSFISRSGRLNANIIRISVQHSQVVEINILSGNSYIFAPKKNGDGWILKISTINKIKYMPGTWINHYNPKSEAEKYITLEVDSSPGSSNPDFATALTFFKDIFDKLGRFEVVEPIQLLPQIDSDTNDNASRPKRDPPPSITPSTSRPQKKAKVTEESIQVASDSDGDYSDGEEKEEDLNEFRIPRCLNIFYDGWFFTKANDVGLSLEISKDSVIIELIKIGMPNSPLKISLPISTVENCKLLGAGSDDLNFIYLNVRESQKPNIIKNMVKADAQFITQEGEVEDLKKLRICTKSLSRRLHLLLREVIPKEKLQIIYGNPEIPQVPGDTLTEIFKKLSFSPIAFNFGRYAYFVNSSVSIQVETSLPRWQWKPQIFISLDSPDKSMGLKLNGFDERIRFTLTEYHERRWILFIKHFSNDFIKEFSSQLNLDVNLLDFCNPESNDPLRMYLGIIFESSQKERKKAFGQIKEIFDGQTNFRISDIQNVHSGQTIDITKDPGPTTFNFRCSSVHFGSLATLGRNSILIELKENGKPMITLSVFNTNGKENKHTIRFKNSNEYILTKYGLEGWILFLGVAKFRWNKSASLHPEIENFFQPGSNDTKLKYISLVVQSNSSKQRERDVDAMKGIFGNLKNFYFNPDLKPLIRNVENNLESNSI